MLSGSKSLFNFLSRIEIIDNDVLEKASRQAFRLKTGGEAVGVNI